MTYSPTTRTLQEMHRRAKGKKDGIYTYLGHLYLVKNGVCSHFWYQNEVFEVVGAFIVRLGPTTQGREALTHLERIP